MMDHGQPPDQKRQRVGSWSSNLSQDRLQHERPHLPLPPPPRQYPHEAGSPFNGPENPLNPRRHSEQQAQYEPDPRRPSSGPHSGHSHGYHPHQPHSAPPYAPPPVATMKRDPGEEHASQYTPTSRGNGPEHSVGATQYGHLPPFDSHPAPPGSIPFRPPGSYATPQSPMPTSEPHYPSYGPPHQGQRADAFASVSYPQQVGGVTIKRKAQRAAQACDSCRNLKAKCDEGRPSCLSCKDKNIQCVYRDPPPKQQDKTQTDILDGMTEMRTLFMNQLELVQGQMSSMKDLVQGQMSSMTGLVQGLQRLQGLNEKVDRIEKELKLQNVTSPPSHSNHSSLKEDGGQASSIRHIPAYSAPLAGSVPHEQDVSQSSHASPSTPDVHMQGEGLDQPEEAGDPVTPGPSSIPVNHRTGAARLLLVPPIYELAKDANPFKNSEHKISFDKYPMILEERRGLLRLYGRGQGLDRPPGYEREPLVDYPSESTPSDTASDPSTPPGEEWGQIGGLTPPPEDTPIVRRGGNLRLGLGVNAEGIPDLSPETVKLLVQSYITHMNIMHPILVPARLWSLVDIFLKTVPSQEGNLKQRQPPSDRVQAGFLGGRSVDSPGTKRKRSSPAAPPTDSYEAPNNLDYKPSNLDYKPGHPFRSISTALILMVMALGSVCLHKDKIPDLVSDREAEAWDGSSPASRNGNPRSPLQAQPGLPVPTGLPSPQEADRTQSRSRRTSLDGPPLRAGMMNQRLRNLDVIPGLSYFAVASDIIGNQIGGNSLQHVHVNILAGLYHGQLGRVLESSAYIGIACRSLIVILNPKLDRFKKLKNESAVIPYRDNPLVFAFWTCLQLESDIIAELNVPMSGILNLEENMPTPNVRAAVERDQFDQLQITSYMTQLHLRKHLNQLHTMFYNPDESDEAQTSKPSYYPTIAAVEKNLRGIKETAIGMDWDENDPPATDILGARLRAKYYGAEVITYRSFILKILINSAENSPRLGATVLNEYKTNIIDPTIDTHATRKEDLNALVYEYAQRCIKALIKSTTAFHGLGDPGHERLIVTNVWGTAHAQWGNVLTLLAAFEDPILKGFIDEKELRGLLYKTLAFLKFHMHAGPPSPSALVIDRSILKHVGQKVGLLPPPKSKNPQTSSANSSFESNHSADVSMTGS